MVVLKQKQLYRQQVLGRWSGVQKVVERHSGAFRLKHGGPVSLYTFKIDENCL